MKRLFQINKPSGSPYTVPVADGHSDREEVLYFSDKAAAKAERNALNSRLPKPAERTAEQNYAAKSLYTVGYGPDHDKNKE